MYVPRHFAMSDRDQLAVVRALVADVHVAQLVTVGSDGVPDATLLPILWEGDEVIAHLARANVHWQRVVEGSPGHPADGPPRGPVVRRRRALDGG